MEDSDSDKGSEGAAPGLGPPVKGCSQGRGDRTAACRGEESPVSQSGRAGNGALPGAAAGAPADTQSPDPTPERVACAAALSGSPSFLGGCAHAVSAGACAVAKSLGFGGGGTGAAKGVTPAARAPLVRLGSGLTAPQPAAAAAGQRELRVTDLMAGLIPNLPGVGQGFLPGQGLTAGSGDGSAGGRAAGGPELAGAPWVLHHRRSGRDASMDEVPNPFVQGTPPAERPQLKLSRDGGVGGSGGSGGGGSAWDGTAVGAGALGVEARSAVHGAEADFPKAKMLRKTSDSLRRAIEQHSHAGAKVGMGHGGVGHGARMCRMWFYLVLYSVMQHSHSGSSEVRDRCLHMKIVDCSAQESLFSSLRSILQHWTGRQCGKLCTRSCVMNGVCLSDAGQGEAEEDVQPGL